MSEILKKNPNFASIESEFESHARQVLSTEPILSARDVEVEFTLRGQKLRVTGVARLQQGKQLALGAGALLGVRRLQHVTGQQRRRIDAGLRSEVLDGKVAVAAHRHRQLRKLRDVQRAEGKLLRRRQRPEQACAQQQHQTGGRRQQRRGAPAGKQRDHLARRLSGAVLRVHTLKRSLHQLPWRVNAIHGLFIM